MSLQLVARAKVNLVLEVLGRRDDGYHDVRTIMQGIDLCDRLDFHPAPALELSCTVPELESPANLVWRAAERLRRETGYAGGARIHLQKGIPLAGGLGGGSADAAATLIGLSRLWGLGLGPEHLATLGAELGTDVPYFLTGGTAFAEGRGDTVTPLPSLPSRWVVLLAPNLHVEQKTRVMYAMLTSENYTGGGRSRRALSRIRRGLWPDPHDLYNVFERPARWLFPTLPDLVARFRAAGTGAVHLSGAGPCCYMLFGSRLEAEAVAAELCRQQLSAWAVRTTNQAVTEVAENGVGEGD